VRGRGILGRLRFDVDFLWVQYWWRCAMNRKALMAKGLLALIAEFAVFATLLFVAAGTVLWSAGWVFMAIFFGFSLAITLWVGHESPELLAERLATPIQRDQPLWDRVFVAAVMPLFVVWLILMPLDAVRFGWSQMPGWLQVMGALALVLSFYVLFLTFRENAYLALVVKVQEERGQTVVTSGPYRYVRHPMYGSMFLFLPGSALLLGSWWGLLLCLVILGLLVWRTTLEERMLKKDLAGYEEYARHVRYRLIPRVW
jgi:protein-S-isoprenylcysteine O-methyltransferase Ste14